MATELVYLMYKTVIESTPFFEGLPRDVQTKLCLSMKPYPALSGDVIMTEGEAGKEKKVFKRHLCVQTIHLTPLTRQARDKHRENSKKRPVFLPAPAGHEMFLIMKGTVAISKGGQVLGRLSDGSFFGEMAILSHGGRETIRKRTATAASTCDLCFLGRETVAVCENGLLKCHLCIKMLVLPRRARDKHGENSKTDRFHSGTVLGLPGAAREH